MNRANGSPVNAKVGDPLTVDPAAGAAMAGVAGTVVSTVKRRPSGTPSPASFEARVEKT